MSWISAHTSEVIAISSVVTNMTTLLIILFNINQFKLNSRSLNIDVNFKVFELRKKIYRDTEDVIQKLRNAGNFLFLINNDNGNIKNNKFFENLREDLENSKYLFSKHLFKDLERLVLLLDTGVALEGNILQIKEENPEHWTTETTENIKDLTVRKKEIIDCILEFNVEQFINYLNISKFHKDFISEKNKLLDYATIKDVIKNIFSFITAKKQDLLLNYKKT